MKFNELKTRINLADFLDEKASSITYILYKKKVENLYYSFSVPKKTGGSRKINSPEEILKRIQRKLAVKLYEHYVEGNERYLTNFRVSHGFEKNRNTFTNAQIHRRKKILLNVDIENFFDSFHFGRVRGFFHKNKYFKLTEEMSTILAQLTCYNGKLPQGAPTSPVLTNLIFNIVDMKILKITKKYKLNYTRYADDLTFSTNDNKFLSEDGNGEPTYQKFLSELRELLEKNDFKINEKKIRLELYNSRQSVTGLVVNNKILVDKNFVKTTRAMFHSLVRNGEFYLENGDLGTINQLEGRFAYINQIERSYNKIFKKYSNIPKLFFKSFSSREKQYQKFLFYKYFFNPVKPLIVTEGKTDILYIKAALKKYYTEYPNLIEYDGEKFLFKIKFFPRGKDLSPNKKLSKLKFF